MQGQQTYTTPSPQSKPAPTQPRKARKGRLAAAVLVLLLLIGGGVGTFLFVRTGQAKPTTPTAHVTTTPANITPTTGSTGTVGQPLQAGQTWIVTLTNVHSTTTSDYPPKAGYTYLEFSLTLKNISANKQFVSSMVEFTLTDANGVHYIETVSDTNIRKALDGNIAFGQTLTGQVAYHVPQSQHHFTLAFNYGLPDGSSDAVSWSITL